MPKTTFPRDRFDDLPADVARVGAHRAENPRMRGWVVFLWAAIATIILVAAGIFATLVAQGRIVLSPTPEPTVAPTPVVTPVVDTSYSVVVLNATSQPGLATQVKDQIVAAGWSADSVTAGEAGSTDFAETTVYFPFPADEAAAAGLAGVVGGARVEQSDFYLREDDPETPEDESKQLTVVLGMDRIAPAAEDTPAP